MTKTTHMPAYEVTRAKMLGRDSAFAFAKERLRRPLAKLPSNPYCSDESLYGEWKSAFETTLARLRP
jgi:hypothetical protein